MSISNIKRLVLVLVLLFTFAPMLAACSSDGTSGNDALSRLSNAFCSKAVDCNCAGVVQSTCANSVSSSYKSVGFDTSQKYSSDSVKKCTGDIGALACPPEGAACAFTVPSSCPGQGATLPIGDTTASDGGTVSEGESDAAPE